MRPVFVVGAPRSGTTLVGNILGQHPLIYSPGETHFFEDIWSRRQKFGELRSELEITQASNHIMNLFHRYSFPESQEQVDKCVDQRLLIRQTLEKGGGYAALYESFMLALTLCAGKSMICDDTPKHLFYLPDIVKLFPNAKFVGMVRDPRGFLYSYRNYWRRSVESDRIKSLYHPVMTSMLWRASSKKIFEYREQYGAKQVLLLQYERLVENPQREIRQLSEFIEVEYNRSMLEITDSNSSFNENSRGIFTSSVSRWENNLPPEDTWWCQLINRGYFKRLSLEPTSIKPLRLKLLVTLISTPIAILRALRANRMKRGPTVGYLTRRIRALLP